MLSNAVSAQQSVEEAERVFIFQLRIRRTKHGWSEKIYDDFSDFEEDLIEAMSEIEADYNSSNPSRRLIGNWLRAFRKGGDWDNRAERVEALLLFDGQWVDMLPRLIAPSVEFDAAQPWVGRVKTSESFKQ